MPESTTSIDPAHEEISQMERAVAACPTCRGFGQLRQDIVNIDDPRFGRLAPCQDCAGARKRLYDAKMMTRLSARITPYSAMTAALRECTFRGFDTQVDERAVAAHNATIRWIRGEIPWVYIYGPPGNGKTHLAAAAVNHLSDEGQTAFFTTAPDLLALIRTGFDEGDSETHVQLCQRVSWLVIDDLGVERLTAWASEIWFRILNARYSSRCATLIAGNVAPRALGDDRLASRFGDPGVCLVVPNAARDYRPRKAVSQTSSQRIR